MTRARTIQRQEQRDPAWGLGMVLVSVALAVMGCVVVYTVDVAAAQWAAVAVSVVAATVGLVCALHTRTGGDQRGQ